MPAGVVAQFLQQNAGNMRGMAVKREMLELECAFFKTRNSVLFTERKHIENIIRYVISKVCVCVCTCVRALCVYDYHIAISIKTLSPFESVCVWPSSALLFFR